MIQLVETERMRVEAESLQGVLWVQVYFKDPNSGKWYFDAGPVPVKQLTYLRVLVSSSRNYDANQERTSEGTEKGQGDLPVPGGAGVRSESGPEPHGGKETAGE